MRRVLSECKETIWTAVLVRRVVFQPTEVVRCRGMPCAEYEYAPLVERLVYQIACAGHAYKQNQKLLQCTCNMLLSTKYVLIVHRSKGRCASPRKQYGTTAVSAHLGRWLTANSATTASNKLYTTPILSRVL